MHLERFWVWIFFPGKEKIRRRKWGRISFDAYIFFIFLFLLAFIFPFNLSTDERQAWMKKTRKCFYFIRSFWTKWKSTCTLNYDTLSPWQCRNTMKIWKLRMLIWEKSFEFFAFYLATIKQKLLECIVYLLWWKTATKLFPLNDQSVDFICTEKYGWV